MFRPDITEMVDWVLKTNDLSIYLSFFLGAATFIQLKFLPAAKITPNPISSQEKLNSIHFLQLDPTALGDKPVFPRMTFQRSEV